VVVTSVRHNAHILQSQYRVRVKHVVPLGFSTVWEHQSAGTPEKDIDVLFFGTVLHCCEFHYCSWIRKMSYRVGLEIGFRQPGVITPYREQIIQRLQSRLRKYKRVLPCVAVHRAQGS
jgi:hypothetical protein